MLPKKINVTGNFNSSIDVPPKNIALAYLAQAGFCLKTHSGSMMAIDPYLTDCVERIAGFKRMIPSVVAPEFLDADIFLATHSHPDHLDEDALPFFAKRPAAFFIGSADCEASYKSAGISGNRFKILRVGDEIKIGDYHVRATYADHGNLAPDAIGYLISTGGITIYNVGDSAYVPEKILKSLGNAKVDVMIAPINGAYGNLDASEACMLAASIKPKILIASHFWMFIEHGGDPTKFLEESKKLSGTKSVVMTPEEVMIIKPGDFF